MTAFSVHGILLLWTLTLQDSVLSLHDPGERGLSPESGKLREIQQGAGRASRCDDDSKESSSRNLRDQTLAIVGGGPARIGTNPWQAALLEKDDLEEGPFCGGSLISYRHVLTAGHCVITDENYLCWCCLVCTRKREREPQELIVRLGAFNWKDSQEPSARNFDVDAIFLHPGYYAPSYDDIALLRLDTEVTFGTFIDKISLPPPRADYTGKMARVSGWGLLKKNGSQPDELQSLEVKILDDEVCQKVWVEDEETENSICAGLEKRGKDICSGDSGGPLSVKNSETGRFELVGVASASECGLSRTRPGAYMRVSYYLDWIELKMDL